MSDVCGNEIMFPIISFLRVDNCKLAADTEQLELDFDKDERIWLLTYRTETVSEPLTAKIPIFGRYLEGCPHSYDDPDLDEIAYVLDEWGVEYSLLQIEVW